jgi:hypothetical protein
MTSLGHRRGVSKTKLEAPAYHQLISNVTKVLKYSWNSIQSDLGLLVPLFHLSNVKFLQSEHYTKIFDIECILLYKPTIGLVMVKLFLKYANNNNNNIKIRVAYCNHIYRSSLVMNIVYIAFIQCIALIWPRVITLKQCFSNLFGSRHPSGLSKIWRHPYLAKNDNWWHPTECFIDLGKLNLLKISLPWSKSVKLTVGCKVSIKRQYRRTSLFAVDTFCQLTANTETANTESNND